MRSIQPEKMSEMKEMTEGPARKIYPHFGIGLKHLPEAKKWDLEKKYVVTLELTMTGKSINERMGREDGYADFDITGIEVQSKKKDFKVLYKS